MRKIILLALLAIGIYASCKKNPVDNLNYYLYAEKTDNTIFKSNFPDAGFRSVAKKDTLYMRGSSGEYHLTIRVLNKGAGVYNSTDIDALLYITLGQDVIVGTYRLNNDPGNIVKITSINNGIVEATFDLTLKEVLKGSNATPRVLTFSNGRVRSSLSANTLDLESIFKFM